MFIILFLAAGLALTPSLAGNGGNSGNKDNNGVAAGKGRIAADLLEILETAPPDQLVAVVVNLNSWSHAEQIARKAGELGGKVRMGLKKVRQMVLDMPAGAVDDLLGSQGLDYMAPDRPVASVSSHLAVTTGASQVYPPSYDEPLSSFLISGGLVGYDGSGIGVAVVDSGIYGDHLDLRDGGRKRLAQSVDFVGRGPADDPFGHGTHVAGIIAGNGAASRHSDRNYAGMAPGAHLIGLRVLDDMGRGRISDVIAAVDFAIANRMRYNIRVVNLSLAAPPVDSFKDDPLCHAVERAVDAGLAVAAAAGNFGVDPYGRPVYGAITSPGICPSAITVGAADTRRTDARSDDRVAPYSSRGPTRSRDLNPATGRPIHDHLPKPDLVAPGSAIVSLERPNNTIVRYFPHLHVDTRGDSPRTRYMRLSGSSMATGVVSGALALVLQANPALTPNMARAILMYSAQIVEGEDLFEQGAGLLNVEGAMRIARVLSGDLDLTARTLAPSLFPKPTSRIAGENVRWSQGLLWNEAWVSGTAALARQQAVYAQGLIWGFGGWSVWGANVVYSDGLYSETHVVTGRKGEWSGVLWDSGVRLENGVLFRDDLSADGVAWTDDLMLEDFYSVSPTSLIWGRTAYDVGLIWGLDRFLFGSGLIWGFGLYSSV